MKFLIINSNYPESIAWLYTQKPGLELLPFEDHVEAYLERMPGTTYFYVLNLLKFGHEAHAVIINNEFMQREWALEHEKEYPNWRWQLRLRKGIFPWVSRVRDSHWFYDILAAQIKHYKPDVLINLAMDQTDTSFIREMKSHVKLMIGEGDAALPLDKDYCCYNLLRCSLPTHVQFFRRKGIPCELYRFGFEPTILDRAQGECRSIDISFVGSLSPAHKKRVALLETLCAKYGVRVWAPRVDWLPEHSAIRQCYAGQAWGFETYRILRLSKITLNCQIDSAGSFADNIRLYEATGLETLLITDWKDNLHEMFQPGREVVAYRTPDECAEFIQYYLEHHDEREAIARAGQQRTLRDHTYCHRMQELVDIVRKYL